MSYCLGTLTCDECGFAAPVTTRWGLPRVRWQKSATLPGWRTHRTETDAGVTRHDLCPACKAKAIAQEAAR